MKVKNTFDWVSFLLGISVGILLGVLITGVLFK